MRPIYLAEIDAVVDNNGTIVTLRFASEGYASLRTDAPPDAAWLPYLREPAQVEQYLWGNSRTGGVSTVGFGTLELNNADGELDYLAAYDFSGQRVALRVVEEGGAYADSTLVMLAQAEQLELDHEFVVVRLRDRQADLQQPIAGTLFTAGSDGGIPPLTRMRTLATISEVGAASEYVEIELSSKPVVGRHLVLQAVVQSLWRQGGSVSFPAISDNQGGVWKYQIALLLDSRIVLTAVCRQVADPVPAQPYVITLQVPAAGANVEGLVQELSGALSSSIWRARAPSALLVPVPVGTSLVTNALPIVGDYAITTIAVDGVSGDAGIQQPGGWVPDFTQINLAASVAGASASRQVVADGAVDVIWYCANSAGAAAVADLLVLASGTD